MASANAISQQGPVRFWDRLSIGTKRVIWAWAFLALPIIFYAGIRFYPTFQAFWLSLTNWDLLRPAQFIGFANYQKMFADPIFWKVFNNTFLYLIIGTPLSLVISFVIAYYLDRVKLMHGFIRALYFLPYLTTAAAMGWVWRWFYQPVPIGVINGFLSTFRSSSSWRACAPSPTRSMKPRASTASGTGRSCARSPFRC
jgi:multiple sugar transport system permease protein